jgi:putative oxidoreductase
MLSRTPVVLARTPALVMFTLLRIVVGGVLAAHGFQKIGHPEQFTAHLSALGMPLPEVMAYLAMAGEALGGLGLVIGLLTPIACFGIAATMFVAMCVVHLKHGLFAADGGFEYPFVLLCAALWFMAAGAGPFSLDALLRRRGTPRIASQERPPQVNMAVLAARATEPEHYDPVDEAGLESFPASDPPAHSRRDS